MKVRNPHAWKRRLNYTLAALGILVVFVGWGGITLFIWWLLGGRDPDDSEWFDWYFFGAMGVTGLAVWLYERTKG